MSFIQQSAAANQRFSSSSSAAASSSHFTNNKHVQRKQLSSNQGGSCMTRRSTSGSDTDVSTSNENLSNEERYVIRHTARQEPQGQENQQHSPSRLSVCSSSSSHKENLPNIQGNLANRNTLKDSLNCISNRNSLKESLNGSNRNSLKDSAAAGSNRNSLKENLSSSNRTSIGSNRSSLDVSTSSYNTLIIHNANEDNLWAPAAAAAGTSRLSSVVKEHGDMGYLQQQQYCESGGGNGHLQQSNSPTAAVEPLSSLPLENHIYVNCINQQTGCQEITDIPDDYLNQSQVLKHLAKEVRVPSYSKLLLSENCSADIGMSAVTAEGIQDPRGRNEYDSSLPSDYDDDDTSSRTTLLCTSKIKHKKLGGPCDGKLNIFSRSQPDLSRISSSTDCMNHYNLQTISPRPQTKGREEFETPAGEIWPTLGMVELLIQENSTLKLELDRCYKRVAKSQQLESDIQKVQRAHKDLVASSERREKLERAARSRLQSDCRRLTELNRALRDQIDLLSTRAESSLSIDSLRKELQQKDLVIGQLINSTKELAAAKERQEIELAAQRATLQEQRTHIDILDTALTNAQSNVVRLEEECRKKQVYVERVGQLQRALSSLQASSDRREETERQLRFQLERELREGNAAAAAAAAASSSPASFHGDSSNGAAAVAVAETVHELKRKLRERNEKIMSLEGDVAKWEQRYLEESALRQAAIDAASLPKDAKIAALEKTSQEAEKLIAEAHAEKMRQMDKVHAAQKKLADLESRMKELESKLAERDAMIRVLQKHTYDKADATSSSSGVGSYQAAHSSHSSSASAADHHHHHHHHHHTALTSAPPELVSSVLGGGSGYSSTAASYGGVSAADAFKYSSSSSRKQASFEQTNKSLDDQLKELDSQLVPVLSKRALCCFPGFSNPGAPSRKGKIPKPLLASVAGGSAGGCSSTVSSKSRLLGGECGGGGGGDAADESEAASSSSSSSAAVMLSASNAILDLAVAASRGVFKSRFSDEACGGGGKPAEDMMLLEKQGRSSQRQRMSSSQEPPPSPQQQHPHHHHLHHHQQQQPQQLDSGRRAGSLPPSSLPRPPRSSLKAATRYCRLSDSADGTTTAMSSGSSRKKPSSEASEVYRFEPAPSSQQQHAQAAAAAKLSLLRRKQSSESQILMSSFAAAATGSGADDTSDYLHPAAAAQHHQQQRYQQQRDSSFKNNCKKSVGQYERLGQSPRSLIPPPPQQLLGSSAGCSPRRFGGLHPTASVADYGRLSDSAAAAAAEPKLAQPQQQQVSVRGQSTGSIGSIKSDTSTASAILKSANRSIPRPSNYKIQF